MKTLGLSTKSRRSDADATGFAAVGADGDAVYNLFISRWLRFFWLDIHAGWDKRLNFFVTHNRHNLVSYVDA